jgi:hypothetical protein
VDVRSHRSKTAAIRIGNKGFYIDKTNDLAKYSLWLISIQKIGAADALAPLRLNFIHSPLSDLFLVYRERRDTDGGGVLDRRLTAKVSRLFPF